MTLVSMRNVMITRVTELGYSSDRALNPRGCSTDFDDRYHVGLTPLDLTSWRPDVLLPSTTWEL